MYNKNYYVEYRRKNRDKLRIKQREYQKIFVMKNPEKVKEWKRKYREENPEKNKQYKENLQIKKAGRMKPKQCEVCGSTNRICFDHDHKTGKFRGWICCDCNAILGFAKDNSQILILLSKYLNN